MDRQQLVANLRIKGIANDAVLSAIEQVPRELFLSHEWKDVAYDDTALPASHGQTISQPYVVAKMTELLLTDNPCQKVLEVGTGTGYQSAILAQIVPEVYTIERIKPLHEKAKERLQQLSLSNVHCRYDDGYLGWPEKAPFDGIIVTAAAISIPDALLQQLSQAGRLVIPVGRSVYQELLVVTRHNHDFSIERTEGVVFVPMLHGTSEKGE